jgi:hypothetical protein
MMYNVDSSIIYEDIVFIVLLLVLRIITYDTLVMVVPHSQEECLDALGRSLAFKLRTTYPRRDQNTRKSQ